MTVIVKELSSDHIIGYGKKVDGDNVTIKFQFHPAIEEWLKFNNIVPEYSTTENVEGLSVNVCGYEGPKIFFTESEIKNSIFDVKEILSKVKVTVSLSKHQARFKFPVFKKVPKLKLSKEEKAELVKNGIWSQDDLIRNS